MASDRFKNDEHFVMAYLFNCFDFDELLDEFLYVIFKSILPLNLLVYYPPTKSEGYILASSLHPSVHSVCPSTLFVR